MNKISCRICIEDDNSVYLELEQPYQEFGLKDGVDEEVPRFCLSDEMICFLFDVEEAIDAKDSFWIVDDVQKLIDFLLTITEYDNEYEEYNSIYGLDIKSLEFPDIMISCERSFVDEQEILPQSSIIRLSHNEFQSLNPLQIASQVINMYMINNYGNLVYLDRVEFVRNEHYQDSEYVGYLNITMQEKNKDGWKIIEPLKDAGTVVLDISFQIKQNTTRDIMNKSLQEEYEKRGLNNQ